MLFIQLWGLIGFQTGAVFMINGAVVGMDAFGKEKRGNGDAESRRNGEA